MKIFRKGVRRVFEYFGYEIIARDSRATTPVFPLDFSADVIRTVEGVQPFTMTSPERIGSLIQAVEYVLRTEIPGDIVECGVWRGGSMMAVALTLLRLNRRDKLLHLFDTFEGMPPPTDVDRSIGGECAAELLETRDRLTSWIWAYAQLEEVKRNMASTDYPTERIKYIQGKVEDTIPANVPEKIALLRLDTDWYESTKHELEHLFPRLSPGGVLIIDDYGHWEGARKAVDEYIEAHQLPLLLCRIDYTGRIAIKQQERNSSISVNPFQQSQVQATNG